MRNESDMDENWEIGREAEWRQSGDKQRKHIVKVGGRQQDSDLDHT